MHLLMFLFLPWPPPLPHSPPSGPQGVMGHVIAFLVEDYGLRREMAEAVLYELYLKVGREGGGEGGREGGREGRRQNGKEKTPLVRRVQVFHSPSLSPSLPPSLPPSR